MATNTDDPAVYLIAQAEATGVACATTKDSHVLVFKRARLVELIEKIDQTGRDVGVIVVKRQNVEDAN